MDIKWNKCVRKSINHPVYVVTNFLILVASLGTASFTDYSKATRVRKFYPAWTGVMETKCISYKNITTDNHIGLVSKGCYSDYDQLCDAETSLRCMYDTHCNSKH